MKNDNLDTLLECAIREKGVMEHMAEIDRHEKQMRRRRVQFLSFGVAACLAIVVCTGLKLSHDARVAGYAFDPAFGQMGGSEITALMAEKRIDEAVVKIEDARVALSYEKAAPSSTDPEYLQQLETDEQELDLLEAVCLMRKGKYFKAKKALKAIIAEGGAWSAEAEQLLESM